MKTYDNRLMATQWKGGDKLINSVENLITPVQEVNRKKNSIEEASGGFEMLLALLMNQSFNVPGNISPHVGGIPALNMGSKSISGIMGKGAGIPVSDIIQEDGKGSLNRMLSKSMNEIPEALILNGEAESPISLQGNTLNGGAGAVVADEKQPLYIKAPVTQPEITYVLANAALKEGLNIRLKQQPIGDKAASAINNGNAINDAGKVILSDGTPDAQMMDIKATQVKEGSEAPDVVKVNISQAQFQSTDEQYIVNRPEILKLLKAHEMKDAGKQPGEHDGNGAAYLQESINKENTKEIAHINALTDGAFDSFHNILNNTRTPRTLDNSLLQDGSNTVRTAEDLKESILNQIFDKARLVKGSNISELHVSLKPAELGEVAIKLVMDKGVMTGKILVENSYAKELIQSNIAGIKENLKLQDLNVSGFSVSVGLNHQYQPGHQFNQNYTAGRWANQRNNYQRVPDFEGMEAILENIPGSIAADRLNLLV